MKAALTNGSIELSLVKQTCRDNWDYCSRGDPSQSYMTQVSARLINEMADNPSKQTILLHTDGSTSNPVFRLLEGPGPYWHYAVAQRLIEAIKPLTQ